MHTKFRSGIWKVIFLVGKHEGKRPLGRTRRKWVVILKFILKKWFRGHGTD
jgi:hypothetical protein